MYYKSFNAVLNPVDLDIANISCDRIDWKVVNEKKKVAVNIQSRHK